jgi:hypothetical protein
MRRTVPLVAAVGSVTVGLGATAAAELDAPEEVWVGLAVCSGLLALLCLVLLVRAWTLDSAEAVLGGQAAALTHGMESMRAAVSTREALADLVVEGTRLQENIPTGSGDLHAFITQVEQWSMQGGRLVGSDWPSVRSLGRPTMGGDRLASEAEIRDFIRERLALLIAAWTKAGRHDT